MTETADQPQPTESETEQAERLQQELAQQQESALADQAVQQAVRAHLEKRVVTLRREFNRINESHEQVLAALKGAHEANARLHEQIAKLEADLARKGGVSKRAAAKKPAQRVPRS